MDEWVNVGTERAPRFEHVHADGTRHKTDQTIPMLSDASEAPRYWRARFICRRCGADREQRWVDGDGTPNDGHHRPSR